MQAPSTAANSAFRSKFEDLLARAPAGTMRHHDFVRVPSNQKPWLDTGIDLAAGETVTTIGVGQTFLTGTPLSFDADFQLWYRVGADVEAFRGTRATNSSMSRAISPASGRREAATSPRPTRPMTASPAISTC